MLRQVLLVLLILCSSRTLLSVEPGKILPGNMKYDAKIPTPQKCLGFKIGQRHIHHHEIVKYLKQLADSSDRVTIQQYAQSHGGRPLLTAFITSPNNHKQLKTIRRRHLRLAVSADSDDVNIESLPVVVNMGYGVHGNEASASNAAVLVAYYLAAAQGATHEQLLENTVVILDPCLNPDGFERFANWVNDHRGTIPNPDPNHREHREAWPSGRTNYYWFDLNRDWLPAQHPESRGRVALFHRWKPNVVLDFHEMGTNATYFFQPGVPTRNHPLTPLRTFELTREFAKFHAGSLDQAGSLYFSEERFDDFYPGKGSTYPDLHGSIGILFEQASARGHIQESVNGPLSFSFAIRNHVLTSMSSLWAAFDNRKALLEHKRTFFQDGIALARAERAFGYVVAAPGDPVRLYHFLDLLTLHQIQSYRLRKDIQIDGQTYRADESFVIPYSQPEYRFLKALMEKRTEFEENTFYDISTWTLPLAFNLKYAETPGPLSGNELGDAFSFADRPTSKLTTDAGDVGYVVEWQGYLAPRTLYRLLDADIRVKVATQPFHLQFGDQTKAFDYGTLLIPLGIQPEKRNRVIAISKKACSEGVNVYPATSGLTPQGIDFGSSSFATVAKPKILLVAGDGVSSREAGEVWHLLDHRFKIPVSMIDSRQLSRATLSDYTVIVMVSGSYWSITDTGAERLKRFATEGGTLVTIGTATRWINEAKIVEVDFRATPDQAEQGESEVEKSAVPRRPFANAGKDAAEKLIRGSIFQTVVDSTHPICYGLSARATLPVFRNNTVFLEPARNAYSTPLVYDAEPLLSGYVSKENLEKLANSASVVVRSIGRGRVILMAENPNFRAFWYGTNRIFLNALFFGPLVRAPAIPPTPYGHLAY